MNIRRLVHRESDFEQRLRELIDWSFLSDAETENTVETIIARVRNEGDAALLEFGNHFDSRDDLTPSDWLITTAQLNQAKAALDADLLAAIEAAAARIRRFHERQLIQSWEYTDEQGVVLGQKVTSLETVGVYVPGGKAAYPSTAMMNVIPAQVAGVKNIVMVSPAPRGEINPAVLATASVLGVEHVFTIGGAQAIAALAYGTETIPKVDKIVGPGNRFVAAAKQRVFGQVGLDMVAGPSEILVVCDGKTDPAWIAMDLFSQAEHDEDAQAILVSHDAAFLDAVELKIAELLPGLERESIVRESLQRRAAFVLLQELDDAIEVINLIAPEHLELSIDNPETWLDKIQHAGAIFMGRHTPEAFGDYCAGPNHVLPTSATARFASPLGVYDFQKRTSIIACDPSSAHTLATIASPLARAETLTAHARSAELRLDSTKD